MMETPPMIIGADPIEEEDPEEEDPMGTYSP